jgi:hypothetical protein
VYVSYITAVPTYKVEHFFKELRNDLFNKEFLKIGINLIKNISDKD